jgi:AraC-like DNA-binding protein
MLEHFTILYPVKGKLDFVVSGHKGEICEFSVLCAAPGMQLGAMPAGEQNCNFYLVEFDCSDFNFFDLKNGYFAAAAPRGIQEYFYQLYSTSRSGEPSDYVSDALLLLILADIRKSSQNNPTKQQIYEDIRRFISVHTYDNLSAASIAEALNYNKDYLCRVARQCGGKTLQDMIIDEKISAAKSLLTSTDYTVAKISSLLRYKSSNSFLKFFRYHTNTTPAAYRLLHLP